MNSVFTRLCELHIPVAYQLFKEPVDTPFLLYALDEEHDFCADNTHYYPVRQGWIEVYAKDFSELLPLLTKLENLLEDVPWRKTNEAQADGLAYARYTFTLI